ncbi:hypothetical protein YA29_16540 [Klebsiella aerogenes]|uniref:LysR family transcriptional regulator n=1 Tax=Klebsiella aerogenes TaxID=548 RepID=UPI00063CA199|nr:LysR family transcriptional regulator [Klebsiella aerogenes]KLF28701.1 hypothetical protein YA29_16540 [Klebsiella aerogenes]
MINDLDLKVLKVVHTLCLSGSVSKTADILDVTPGAVSYLLNKARKATGTSLFFRTKNGMEPDTLARELSETYRRITEDLSLKDENSAINNRPVSISAYSLAELLISLAMNEDDLDYPEIIFNRQEYDDGQRLIKLRNREIDLDIGTRLPSDSSIIQISFFAGNAGVLVRNEHPTIKERVTLKDWNENKHAIWLRGMHFINDDFEKTKAFNHFSHERNVAFTSSSSLNLINLCVFSDVIVLVPEIVGKKLSSIMPVKWFVPPEELDMRYECYIHFHHTMASNDTMKKIIELFHKAFV